MLTQQQQPARSMVDMHSQQAWIISLHILSPLVQVMQTPSLVISHLHIPIVRLHVQTVMPFIVRQQLTMPPAIIEHRFCTMVHAALSEQEQVIFIPFGSFSTFIEQRGTIRYCAPVGMVTPCVPIEGMLTPVRSIIMLVTATLLRGIVKQVVNPPRHHRKLAQLVQGLNLENSTIVNHSSQSPEHVVAARSSPKCPIDFLMQTRQANEVIEEKLEIGR
jgi:hypothetical protein